LRLESASLRFTSRLERNPTAASSVRRSSASPAGLKEAAVPSSATPMKAPPMPRPRAPAPVGLNELRSTMFWTGWADAKDGIRIAATSSARRRSIETSWETDDLLRPWTVLRRLELSRGYLIGSPASIRRR
jgi:hypothetical protein